MRHTRARYAVAARRKPSRSPPAPPAPAPPLRRTGTPRAAAQFWFPPGYTANEVTAQKLQNRGPLMIPFRDGGDFVMQTGKVDEFVNAGVAFAGNPDTVFKQIKEFNHHVGGLGHLLMMGQGGHISHEDTVGNLTLFSQEVLPRLVEL